jgi:hypothetical protein
MATTPHLSAFITPGNSPRNAVASSLDEAAAELANHQEHDT